MNQYLNSLDSSSWLQHIKSVLDAAIFITRVRQKKECVKKELFCFFSRLLKLKRKMFLFIVQMVGIEQHNVVHYHLSFFVHIIDQFMVFE
jgi:hypothetical protein